MKTDQAVEVLRKLLPNSTVQFSRYGAVTFEQFENGLHVNSVNFNTLVTQYDLLHLATLPHLNHLAMVAAANVDDDDLRYIGQCNNLRRLNLSSLPISGEGIKHICGLEQLTDLELFDTLLDDEGIQHLSRMKGLRKLDIGATPITDAGMAILKRLPLTQLSIGGRWNVPYGPTITDDALRSIAQIKTLRTLNLSFANVTDAGVKHLAGLPDLQSLTLNDTEFSDEGVRHLASLSSLKHLWLRNTKVTDAMLPRIVDMPKLIYVNVEKTAVTSKALNAMKKNPGLRIN
jgi:Leucine-rich repeat (LRR) protein